MSNGTYREGFITGQDSVLEALQGVNPEAVPDLLGALTAFVDAFNVPDDGGGDRELEKWFRGPMRKARAAIAKAEEPTP